MKPTTFSLAPVAMRRRRAPEEIARLVAEFHHSGLSQLAFARSHRIALSTLFGWLKRSRAGSRPGCFRAKQSLVPVRITGSLPWEGMPDRMEIVLRSGVILRLGERFADEALERLLGILSRQC